jgi:dTDP-4-amino-4,6-dideoxygalactose transaminase
MQKSIQVLKPYFRVDEVLEAIRPCLEIGWTGIGYKTVSLEKKWSEYTGFQNSHFVNSATAGLHLAIRLFKQKWNWQDGDEIITPSLTFVSTNHAILYEGLTPCFCDVDESLCLDPAEVMKAINKKREPSCMLAWAETPPIIKKCARLQTKTDSCLFLMPRIWREPSGKKTKSTWGSTPIAPSSAIKLSKTARPAIQG